MQNNIIYQNVINETTGEKRRPIQEFYTNEEVEIWYDTKIKTLTKCQHNKPDIVLWRKYDKKCFVKDVSVGLDVNVDKNIQLKFDNYLPLVAELKRLYSEYTFEMIPLGLGAT